MTNTWYDALGELDRFLPHADGMRPDAMGEFVRLLDVEKLIAARLSEMVTHFADCEARALSRHDENSRRNAKLAAQFWSGMRNAFEDAQEYARSTNTGCAQNDALIAITEEDAEWMNAPLGPDPACNFMRWTRRQSQPCAELFPTDQTEWCGRCLLRAFPR